MNEEMNELTDLAIEGVENVSGTAGDSLDIQALNEKIEKESAFIDILSMEMNKVIVGQKHMVETIVKSFFPNTLF